MPSARESLCLILLCALFGCRRPPEVRIPDWQPEIDPSEEDEPEDSEGDAALQEGAELLESGT